MRILSVGAAGNLGSHLSAHLIAKQHRLRLLLHKRPLPLSLPLDADYEITHADLNDPASLQQACADIDCFVYLAGVLFAPRPEKFLSRTNTAYAQNIIDATRDAGIKSSFW